MNRFEPDFNLIMENSAKDYAVIASEAGISVQELFDGLGRKLAKLNAAAREREVKKTEVESPT
jgi:hypothetical protein